ncbi:MAG: stage II sporulation protein R [Lachnospiraceae bacterium]
MTMYRQSKEAALIYANSEEELHKLKRDKRLFTILCIIAFILAILAGITLLGVLDIINTTEGDNTPKLSSALMSGDGTGNDEGLSERLSEKLLRMHIIANSDSNADQEVKLQVRNAVVTWLSENMDCAVSKAEAMAFISQHTSDITWIANQVLMEHGYDYKAQVSLGVSHFPGKVYGDFYLPAGDYDALKIVLGEGQGHNWWCIAFPVLCLFGNAEYEDQSGKREEYPLFEVVLDEEEYEEIQVENVRIEFKCKWLADWWPF